MYGTVEGTITVRNVVSGPAPREAAARISDQDVAYATDVLRKLPRLTKALVYTPPETSADHYFLNDPAPPAFAFQLYFAAIEHLEDVLRPDGALQQLAQPDALPSLHGAKVTHQAMVCRPYPVDEPRPQTAAGGLPCSYLVHYPGTAHDMNAWNAYYCDHHPQLMRTFPGIRTIELYTRLDWCSFMPWERVDYMQRNKLMFDDPAALSASARSPTMARMRADYAKFPEFSGGNVHYPMLTREVAPS